MSESNSNKFIANSKIKLFRQNWRDILLIAEFIVIGLMGLYLAWQDVKWSKMALLYEQMHQPTLEYNYRWEFSKTDRQAMLEIADRLIRDYHKQVYEQQQANASLTYPQALNTILPMEAVFSAQPTSLLIQINNTGTTTANQVRVFLTTEHPITSCNVETLEPKRIIDGGTGEHKVTIEIDRIAPSYTTDISIVTEYPTPRSHKVVLFASSSPEELSTSLKLKLVSAQDPNIGVNVTFSEGVGTLHQKDYEFRICYVPLVFRRL
jgi:hypothetical protein